MKVIREIVEVMHDELDGAEEHAKMATGYRDDDKALADMYARMAQTELGNVNALHEQVVRIIEAYRRDGGEPPAPMMAVWNWEHGKMVDNAARVKALLAVYRGE